MTLQHRFLPAVPRGIDIKLLHTNLKLYSDEKIQLIKQQFKTNGRYRELMNANGEAERLPYAVYVFDGKYFACYPGKKLQVGETRFSKIKFVQDLDSGIWSTDKIIPVVDKTEIEEYREEVVLNERDMVEAVDLAVRAGNKAVHFFRPSAAKQGEAESAVVEQREPSFGSHSGMFRRKKAVVVPVIKEGKHDIFARYVHGRNLEQWIFRHPDLPLIIKMEIAIDLMDALDNVHKKNILHRDVKLRNVIANVFNKHHRSLELIDVGLATHTKDLERDAYTELGTPGFMAPEITQEDARIPRQYSVQSDIYALGVTLSSLFRLYPISAFFQGNEKLRTDLTNIFTAMCQEKPENRASLPSVRTNFINLKNQLDPAARTVTVCVLNIVDFMMMEGADPAGMKALYERLQKFHQVRLFDESSAASCSTLLCIKQKLEENGIVVADKYYQGHAADMRAHVKRRSIHASRTGRIYHMACEGIPPAPALNLSESLSDGGDFIIEIADLPLDLSGSDAEEDFLDDQVEEYDVPGCVASFISDVWADSMQAAASLANRCGSSLEFNENDSPEEIELENVDEVNRERLYRVI